MNTPVYEIYLVGGAVRDQLLHYPSADRDWVVVGARPQDLLAQGYQQVGKDFPVFLHPVTKEEYALARRERKQGSGYHGFICDFGPDVSLEDDLSRRDLRINAMAQDAQGNIIDPFGGQQDLAEGVLRHVSAAFSEDPLRVIRVARYAARYAHLDFRVADETLALMRQMSDSGELQSLAAERLWVELTRALGERHPAVFFKVLLDCGALAQLCPPWPAALTRDVLNAVDEAADRDLAVHIRFALSCSALSRQDCEKVCAALRASKAAQQLAILLANHIPLPSLATAEEHLALLEHLDYLRRPTLLADFCAAAELLLTQTEQQKLPSLKTAAEAARTVTAEPLLAQGLQGQALGKALRQRRLEALASAL